jgi:hypothetical protein
MGFICIVVDMRAAVSIIQILSFASKTQELFPFALFSCHKIFRTALNSVLNINFHVRCPMFLFNYDQIRSLWTDLIKITKSYFTKIRSERAALTHGLTDGRTVRYNKTKRRVLLFMRTRLMESNCLVIGEFRIGNYQAGNGSGLIQVLFCLRLEVLRRNGNISGNVSRGSKQSSPGYKPEALPLQRSVAMKESMQASFLSITCNGAQNKGIM